MERRMTWSSEGVLSLLFGLPSVARGSKVFAWWPDLGLFNHCPIFHLLNSFIVATLLKDSARRFDEQLPDARGDWVTAARGLMIEMTAGGAISLNGDLVTQEQLEQHLQSTEGAKANGRW